MGHSNVAINSTIREQCVHTKIAKVRENMKMCRTATHIKQKQTINNLILAAQECGRYGAAPLVFGVAGSTAADQQTDAQRTAPRCLRRQCRRYFGHNVRGLLLQRDQLRDRAGAPILSLPIFALVIDARHVCLGRSSCLRVVCLCVALQLIWDASFCAVGPLLFDFLVLCHLFRAIFWVGARLLLFCQRLMAVWCLLPPFYECFVCCQERSALLFSVQGSETPSVFHRNYVAFLGRFVVAFAQLWHGR